MSKFLQERIKSVRVHSCSDGTFGIEPRWREPFVVKGKLMDRECPPGLFTRMDTAIEIQKIINRALKA